MKVLQVAFKKGLWGFGRKTGQISVTEPLKEVSDKYLRASRPDVRQRILEGRWDHFPAGQVKKMRLAGLGCDDNEWNNIPVKGKTSGVFGGLVRFVGKRNSTSFCFELFDNQGRQRWDTEFLYLSLHPVSEEVLICFAPDSFAAHIQGIRRVRRVSWDDPAEVTVEVNSLPSRASQLALYSAGDLSNLSDKEWHHSRLDCKGPGEYIFPAAISHEYKFKLGTPRAKYITLQFILRALDAKGRPIKHEEIREVFCLDKVET
jgi:hypothetical protein